MKKQNSQTFSQQLLRANTSMYIFLSNSSFSWPNSHGNSLCVPKDGVDTVQSWQNWGKIISISPCIASSYSLPEFALVKDMCSLALTFANFFPPVCILSDGKYMKELDSLSMCTCNRFKQSLPVASCSHFQVYFWHQVLVLKS